MRSNARAFVVGAAVVITAAGSGCGGFLESDSHVERATLDGGGGALHLDVFSLTVPPHALAHTVTLSVSHAPVDAPNGHGYQVDPSDATFDVAAPAQLTITYDAAMFPHPVEVFVATYTGAAWHALPAAGPAEVGAAHATTTHAGTFGLVHCPGGVCPTSASTDASVGGQ